MKVMVIGDVHNKDKILNVASDLLDQGIADQAVCLMDLLDDWGQEYRVDKYEAVLDAAIEFAQKHPKTLWCYGNHEMAYLWHRTNAGGYSPYVLYPVLRKLLDLRLTLPKENPIQFVHRIGNVIFSHGGVLDDFVRLYVPDEEYDDVEKVIETLNRLGPEAMWDCVHSPIWLRPQGEYQNLYEELYHVDQFLHVVGHTPVEEIKKEGNLISCDVFSTRPDGTPIGTREFLLLDTETWEFTGIKIEV